MKWNRSISKVKVSKRGFTEIYLCKYYLLAYFLEFHLFLSLNYIGCRSGLIVVRKSTQIVSDYILACKCSIGIGIGQYASLMICDHNDCHSVVDCYFHLSFIFICQFITDVDCLSYPLSMLLLITRFHLRVL